MDIKLWLFRKEKKYWKDNCYETAPTIVGHRYNASPSSTRAAIN